MAKLPFGKLKLAKNNNTKVCTINGVEVEVKQYLPLEEKVQLIDMSLQLSQEENGYNKLLLDAYFHLNIVLYYTDMTLTAKQKENLEDVYDVLCGNGVIEEVVSVIPEDEYKTLFDFCQEELEDRLEDFHSVGGAIVRVSKELLSATDVLVEQLKTVDFDSDNIKALIDIARDNQ